MSEFKKILDKLNHMPVFWTLENFFRKYNEPILYLFFGGLTFIISVISFVLFSLLCEINELIANILSWLVAVLFAFFTNRIWVFKSPTNTVRRFIVQIITFFSGRIVTLVFEEAILYIFITRLHHSTVLVKIFAQIIVIILNYVISKIYVFQEAE